MRKTRAKNRPLLPDPRFNDPLVTRFVNNMMYDGKKSTAFKIFYDFENILIVLLNIISRLFNLFDKL